MKYVTKATKEIDVRDLSAVITAEFGDKQLPKTMSVQCEKYTEDGKYLQCEALYDPVKKEYTYIRLTGIQPDFAEEIKSELETAYEQIKNNMNYE